MRKVFLHLSEEGASLTIDGEVVHYNTGIAP